MPWRPGLPYFARATRWRPRRGDVTPNGPNVGHVAIRFTETGRCAGSFPLALAPFSHVDDLTVVLAKGTD